MPGFGLVLGLASTIGLKYGAIINGPFATSSFLEVTFVDILRLGEADLARL